MSNETKGLNGKVALVTGASRGIGAAIAEQLAQSGAVVIGTATSDSGAAAINERLAPLGGAGMRLDVTDSAQIDAVLAEIESRFGAVAVLVNNAGITRDTLLLRMKDDDWSAIIDTNLTSVFRLSQKVLRGMTRARWGRIISIASVVGSMGNAGQTNYAAAKAGLMGFSKSLAREVGARNITVNVVAPGFIDTDMTRDLPEAHKTALLANVPLGRLGDPAEIAGCVRFLASDDAAYVTGHTLHVNGGMYMS
ncbi:3-oxoacyl-ACP reductase FabG [Halothiobacillus neapolitanus]|uniref:3-oxoacyl-[acyl-carrier-protein] reductase n=1 Tax=Halothiobacillus neapolitanus (strain ATCC 23641 / DSM 15147 / CIP 104769 / NCIMB 8539 / c2) TaxID=555778 RepID=D0L223_HALNC|nr:3-oxoacyl-ACP reductase FabG [Halothiobacillus neapolitanus]ACX96746.1 3-oxoacyl-(acyl-carrier-protein) reductase [Halothiobacillus neapolitanus c2]TDN65145.1 3-oxoacyl-[acyl-carrier-protein] reductase [Halothiobacillus neapolitanus]